MTVVPNLKFIFNNRCYRIFLIFKSRWVYITKNLKSGKLNNTCDLHIRKNACIL